VVNSVSASARAFSRFDVFAPNPNAYRPKISAMLSKLDGLPPIADEEDALLADIMEDNTAQHLLMINEEWASSNNGVFSDGGLYSALTENVSRITELFSRHDVRLSMAIRNPAYLLNAAYNSPNPPKSLEWLFKRHDPTALNWQDPVLALRKALPEMPLLMWCEEDAPLIWPRVIRAFGALDQGSPVRGGLSAVTDALQPEGMARFRTFLRNHPPKDAWQFERIVLAFLDKYADESIMKQVCNIPGWTNETVGKLSQRYHDDVTLLSKTDGITFILPETQAE
jgi:hypothetical protein